MQFVYLSLSSLNLFIYLFIYYYYLDLSNLVNVEKMGLAHKKFEYPVKGVYVVIVIVIIVIIKFFIAPYASYRGGG